MSLLYGLQVLNQLSSHLSAMVSPLVLGLPKFNKTFVIETDASRHGLGAILSQNGHPLAFASKALSSFRRQLSAYKCELMAIVFAVKQWCLYYWGRKFIIKTNHLPLKHLLKQHDLSQEQCSGFISCGDLTMTLVIAKVVIIQQLMLYLDALKVLVWLFLCLFPPRMLECTILGFLMIDCSS